MRAGPCIAVPPFLSSWSVVVCDFADTPFLNDAEEMDLMGLMGLFGFAWKLVFLLRFFVHTFSGDSGLWKGERGKAVELQGRDRARVVVFTIDVTG